MCGTAWWGIITAVPVITWLPGAEGKSKSYRKSNEKKCFFFLFFLYKCMFIFKPGIMLRNPENPNMADTVVSRFTPVTYTAQRSSDSEARSHVATRLLYCPTSLLVIYLASRSRRPLVAVLYMSSVCHFHYGDMYS